MTSPDLDPPFRLAAYPSFLRLGVARGLSGIAYNMLLVAVGWQLYALTNSALDLGLVGLFQFLPMFCATPLAGHAADAFDRRRVAAIASLICAAATLALALGTLGGWLGRSQIFALVALLGFVRAFEFPAMSSTIALTVPRHHLQTATAFFSSANQTATILGPALGGLIYMIHPAAPYCVAVVLLLAAATAVIGIDAAPQQPHTDPISMDTLSAGARFIRRTPELIGPLSLDLAAVVLGAVVALLPIFARDILGTGPWGLGLLRAAPAVGALGMSLYIARHPIVAGAGQKMFAGVALYGVATIVFGLSTTLPLALIALVGLGAADVMSVVVRQSLVQLRTPDDMRGRVASVNTMFISSSNQLGDFRAGLVAATIGAKSAIILGGVAAVVVAGVWMWMYPNLRTLQRLDR